MYLVGGGHNGRCMAPVTPDISHQYPISPSCAQPTHPQSNMQHKYQTSQLLYIFGANTTDLVSKDGQRLVVCCHKRICGTFEVTQAVLQDSNIGHMNLFLNAGFITDNNDYYTKMYLLKNDCPRLILN